jgi:ABC-type sugar transport system ATPase subunit
MNIQTSKRPPHRGRITVREAVFTFLRENPGEAFHVGTIAVRNNLNVNSTMTVAASLARGYTPVVKVSKGTYMYRVSVRVKEGASA